MMMKKYASKVLVVDDDLLLDLKHMSVTDHDLIVAEGDISTQLIKLPITDAVAEQLDGLIDFADLKPGVVLFKNNYSKSFDLAEDFTENVVLKKYGLFVRLCLALGAKSVHISDIEDDASSEKEKSGLAADISASGPMVDGSASVEIDNSALKAKVNKSVAKFVANATGGEPDLEMAKRLISEYKLHREQMFTDLYAFKENTKNHIQSYEVEMDFTSDVKFMSDSALAAQIDVMAKIYSGSASLKKVKNIVKEGQISKVLRIYVQF